MNVPNAIFAIVAAIVGVLIGSLINMAADDLPTSNHIDAPHYPDGTPRPRFGLIGHFTGKRMAPDGTKTSWRYPLVELVTALLFAYIAYQNGLTGVSLFWMGSIAILILITVIDLEHRLILFIVIIPACIYALVGVALVAPQISTQITFRDYIFGGIAGFAVFFLMYLGGIVFSAIAGSMRGEKLEEVAFGYGDVMLATLSGFMLGWQALIFAIFIAVFAGAAGSLIYLVARMVQQGKYEIYTALPYGQYIVFGTIIMMLWRTPVINYLQNF
jgi:leader peptidase (prepilin peptidase)/N-methyltransferase